MRKYPTDNFMIENLNDGAALEAAVPTPEALGNFELYLEPCEIAFYNGLSDGEKLQIRISCDPFSSLARAMGRDRP